MCVHSCVCVCVHLDSLNAEHKFRVWILGHTSLYLHFHSSTEVLNHSGLYKEPGGGAGGTDQRGSGRKETLEDCQGGTGGTNLGGSSLTRTLEDGQGAGPEGQTRPALTRQEARAEPAAWPAARAAPAGQEAWVQFRRREGEALGGRRQGEELGRLRQGEELGRRRQGEQENTPVHDNTHTAH